MEQRIGFGKRLGAVLLDCVIVVGLVAVLGSTIGGLLGLSAGAIATGGEEVVSAAAMGAMMGMIAAASVLWLAYFLMEAFTGYTVGKLLLGIRVANEDGSQASVSTLVGRYAVKNISSLLGIIGAITGVSLVATLGNLAGLVVFFGFFLVLGMSRQALHDRIAKTAVYPKAAVHAAA